jgi:hypothetical protein
MMAGYSRTPLAKKLGWKAPMTVLTIDAPRDYPEWLADLPAGVRLSSKAPAPIETDVTEDTIRAVALPLGFVDIKVCAVSEVWSGLKLVIRKSERP